MISVILSVGLAVAPAVEQRVDVRRGRMAPASAVTVSYDAEVVAWSDALAGGWEVGQRLTVGYTLDPSSQPVSTGPYSVRYPGAVVSTLIQVPDLDLVVAGGPGPAVVTDDQPTDGWFSDRVSLFSDSVDGAPVVAGETVVESGFGAFDWGPEPGVPSSMVVDSGLPLEPLAGVTQMYVFLFTAEGSSGFVEIRPFRETVTVDYAVTITGATGLHAGAFVLDQPAVVSYTLFPDAPNVDESGETGLYFDGVRSMTVALEDQALAWNGDGGMIVVYDDLDDPPFDAVTVASGLIDQSLGGEPVLQVALEFLKGFGGGPADMIDSVAMPLEPLAATDARILFSTDAGVTEVSVRIEQGGSAGLLALIAQARAEVALIAASPATRTGSARPLAVAVDAIESAWNGSGATAACAQVALTARSVALLVRIRRVASIDVDALVSVLDAMDAELGCSQ